VIIFHSDFVEQSYAVAINWSMGISYRAQIDYIHQFPKFCTMVTVVTVIVVDANIGVNHLMKQSILQIRFIMTFTQGFGKKYNTATTSRIIVTRAYITAVG